MTDDSEIDNSVPAGPDPLDELVARCIEAMETEGTGAVDRICDDHRYLADEIRRRLAELGAHGFLHSVDDVPDSGGFEDPERIGPYVVLEKLGTGGMGTVYLAEQREPVRRRVALKVIKLGMDTQEVVKRFRAERQALAIMSHENIAKVFDAGTTDDGRPYFAMEHVAGISIVAYCDHRQLDTERRLELFVSVCDAVQHAHQKGIIHRDLKPSNVLVTEDGDRPVAKIIDFGVAKAIAGGGLVAETVYTRRGLILGTPEYMSPEQASSQVADIDTRSDVYSLGVILYELLTGSLPFPSERLRSATHAEMVRIIREEDPPTPSTRLSTIPDDGAAAVVRGRTDPQTLSKRLRGDLDWIVMKALEKEPARRYASASELATDIRRHLADEPVVAGPPGAGYRIRKFVRRNRAQVIAGALVAASLVAGLVGTTWFMLEARTAQAAEQRRADSEAGARRAADAALRKFHLLADGVRLREAREAAAALYPAWPEGIDALRAWIGERGEPLARALPDLSAQLVELEGRAGRVASVPPDDATRARLLRERSEAERGRELSVGAAELVTGDDPASAQQRRFMERRAAELGERIAAIDAELAGNEAWVFDRKEDAFLHEEMTELVSDLSAFAAPGHGLLDRVRERLAWAERVEELSILRHADRWQAARRAIARADGVVASSLYADPPIDLEPQIGLVPIGMNPATGLWEFYHLRSAADPETIPAHDDDGRSDGGRGRIDVRPDTGIVFVLLPGGRFLMGAQSEDPDAPNHDPDAQRNEPISTHELEPFLIARHEITQAQWERLADGEQPTHYAAGYRGKGMAAAVTATHPVENVSWDRCDEVLRQHGFALPTDTQWEYACRAGTTTPFSTGTTADSLAGYANVADATAKRVAPHWDCDASLDDGYAVHAPVGTFLPNAFGLYDMHGNVREWCQDLYFASKARIQRGGSYYGLARSSRCALRLATNPDVRMNDVGARAARAVSSR